MKKYLTILTKAPLLYYNMMRTIRYSKIEMERHQTKALRSIVNHAYYNIPYYNKLFKSTGISPDDIQTLKDLEKIPVTTKDNLVDLDLNEYVFSADRNRFFTLRTSGTTGSPMTIFYDPAYMMIRNFLLYRHCLINGSKIRDRYVGLAPTTLIQNLFFHKLGILNTTNISPKLRNEEKYNMLQKINPEVMIANPSSLKSLIAFMKDNHKSRVQNLQIINTRGESVSDDLRKSCYETFGINLIDGYGSIEVGTVSWECNKHSGLHMNTDMIIAEFLDSNGKNLPAGEAGQLTVTCLYNYAMPFIRYSMEDVCIQLKAKCDCGIKTPLMKVEKGREGECIVLKNKTIIPVLSLFARFSNIDGIEKFRLIQETCDSVILSILPNNNFSKESMQKIEEHLNSHLKNKINFKIEKVDTLGNKNIPFISKI